MDDSWGWSILNGIAVLATSMLMGYALPKMEQSPRVGGWLSTVAALPLLGWNIAWVAMANPPDEWRRIISIVIGMFVGGVVAYGATEIWHSRAHAQPPANGGTAVSESDKPTNQPPPINAPNNSGIIAPNNQGSITQTINPAAPRDDMKFYQKNIAVATVRSGQITPDGKVTISEIYNSGELDIAEPVEFRNLIIRITKADKSHGTLMSFRNGAMVSNIIPDVEGIVVGIRKP